MKKNLLLYATILCLMIGLMPTQTQASHNTGGDITYAYTGVTNTFLITYRFYRDCSGIPAPTQINLHYGSVNAGFNGCVLLNPIPGTGNEIPPSPCVPVPPGGTTCTGGTAYGVQEYIFQGTVVLPSQQVDWIYDYEECCRNLVCTLCGQPGLYLNSTQNNTAPWDTNSSPFFNTIPVTQFCANNPFYYNQSAADVDGDSLTYALVDALDATGSCTTGYTSAPICYNAPFSGLYPLATSDSVVNMNPLTGVISFTPTSCCNAVLAVEVTEWDKATQTIIGTIRRDIQINVVCTCNLVPPAFDSTFQSNGIHVTETFTCNDTTFYLVFDTAALIQCGSAVPTDVRVIDPFGMPNPVVSITPIGCVNGLTDSLLVTVLNPLVAGTSYAFTKIGNDGNTFLSECGTPLPEFDSIPLTIIDSSIVTAYADSVGCAFDSIVVHFNQPMDCYNIKNNGSDFALKDATGNTISVVGANCSTHYNNSVVIHVTPGSQGAGPLVLTTKNGSDGNTISNSCETFLPVGDTICLVPVLGYFPVVLGPDRTVCSNGNMPVLIAGSTPSGSTYSWTLNGAPFAGNNDTIVANQSGQYIVNVSVNASCTGTDTVNVTIINVPSVNLGTDATYCAGQTVQTLNATTAGAVSYQWYLNGVALPNDTLATLTPVNNPANTGNYSVVVGLGSVCTTGDVINLTFINTLSVNVSDATFCGGGAAGNLTATGTSGATYTWTGPNGFTGNGATVSVQNSGQYIVTATAGTCTMTDTAIVTVIEQPTPSLNASYGICSGATQSLNCQYIANGAFGTVYNWTGPGGFTGNTQIVNATVAGTYTVTVTNSFGGVTCTATATTNLTVITQPTITVNDTSYCNGGAFPTINSSSNVSSATYSWTYNGTALPDNTASITASSGGGTYTVTATVTGCNPASATSTVTSIPSPAPSLNAQSICQGDVVPINCNYASQTGFNTTYSWTVNSNPDPTNAQSIQSTVAGTYAVTITNSFGGVSCSSNASMTLNVTPKPTVNVTANGNTVICQNSSGNASITLDAGSQPTGASFQWSMGSTVIGSATQQTYSATASNNYVCTVNDNGCKNTGALSVTINPLPVPSIVDNTSGATSNVLFCATNPPVLNSGITGSNYTYSWSVDNSTIVGAASSTLSIASAGIYSVVVTDAAGCTGTDNIDVTEEPCDVTVPNVVNPNSSILNNKTLTIFTGKDDTDLSKFDMVKLQIFDRWGKLIYSTDHYNNDTNKWDPSGVSAGTYYYILETNNKIASKKYHGSVEVIRN